MQDLREAGKEGCRMGEMYIGPGDEGEEAHRKGDMRDRKEQERREAGNERYRK